MKDFSGKTAVITGGASGIGLAMAELFAAQGMKLVLGDIESDALTTAIEKLSAGGAECVGAVTDVSDPDQVQALADLAVERFGGIHIACNNAGVFTGGLLWEESLADYRWLMDVNVMGVVHGIRSFVPIMQAQGDECHIVNTASMAAVTAMPYSGIYHMSKHAVLALSESLYHELSFHSPQVKISVLCPEAINTGIATSERNRHTQYSDVVESDERNMVMDALNASVAGGIGPEVMAQRVLDAVINERFYIFSDELWRRSAETRLEDIRLGRNPTFAPPIPE
ncbi:SDR family NAD(P)-dependent oxidoreductase [Halioglobus maricola]|uniref:SDR family NAD(P)-dependent oxidoreductase n=1 Tax=Halioglobus maricola TaxID=2601894 RepID=A0A5P9NQ48_9GAMM|nr:SDR family NAD(P)-dependent oxidoreductase [Halioglobus maricola]QFU77414.1 SDR family NAD(P)-dependent oxidoreductase [Halioglobus maricola]